MKEMLYKSIVNACHNCKNTYKYSIVENLDDLKNADSETSEKIALAARRKYLDDVTNTVIDSFRLSSPAIFARMQLGLLSPAMCGMEGFNPDDGFMAGSLFAVCYFAIKNKIAPGKTCIQLNHIQNDIMDQVLREIAEEYNL